MLLLHTASAYYLMGGGPKPNHHFVLGHVTVAPRLWDVATLPLCKEAENGIDAAKLARRHALSRKNAGPLHPEDIAIQR